MRAQSRAQRVGSQLLGRALPQNARSRCCSGCVPRAVAPGFCSYCCMLRYCCVRGVLGALLSFGAPQEVSLFVGCRLWLAACAARMRLSLRRSVCVLVCLANVSTRCDCVPCFCTRPKKFLLSARGFFRKAFALIFVCAQKIILVRDGACSFRLFIVCVPCSV